MSICLLLCSISLLACLSDGYIISSSSSSSSSIHHRRRQRISARASTTVTATAVGELPTVATAPAPAPAPDYNGAWLPFGCISMFSHTEPNEVQVAGSTYVVWKAPSDDIKAGWSVMQNVCPHRFAPLSQGRIDPKTGSIECPYHGWQFNTEGACTRIPQGETQKACDSPKTAADAIPVHITEDLIWGFVPLPSHERVRSEG
jgi:nitrite reductase/ring-hydroxylating ferredoxin subunit